MPFEHDFKTEEAECVDWSTWILCTCSSCSNISRPNRPTISTLTTHNYYTFATNEAKSESIELDDLCWDNDSDYNVECARKLLEDLMEGLAAEEFAPELLKYNKKKVL